MNSLERIVAAAGLSEVDRTPVLPVLLQQGATMLDMPLRAYYETPEKLFEGQMALLERFNHDGVFAIPHVVQDTLPWGAGLDFHDDGPPSINRMVFKQFEELEEVRRPVAADHPYLRHSLRTAEKLADAVKGERLIVGAIIGPFSLPSMLIGMDKTFALLLGDPNRYEKYYPRLREEVMNYCLEWTQALYAAGCDIVVAAEGMASASLLTEETFLREALPVLIEFSERAGGLVGLEMVGDALPFAQHLARVPCAVLLIGSNDPPQEMRATMGQPKALMGNINNLKMLRWDAERIEFEARKTIAQAGLGFILSNQGPEVPLAVPLENVEALIRAAHTARLKR
jgi:uroporphyrinogen-III decarboxylase